MSFAAAKPIDFDALGASAHYRQARQRDGAQRSAFRQSVNVSRESIIQAAAQRSGATAYEERVAYSPDGFIARPFRPGIFIRAQA